MLFKTQPKDSQYYLIIHYPPIGKTIYIINNKYFKK